MAHADQDVYTKIKEIRKQKGMTLKDLSEKTDFSVSYLSQMERGKSAITLVSMKKIADVLGVPMRELFLEPEANEEFVSSNRVHMVTTLQRNYDEFSVQSGKFEGRKLDCFKLKMSPKSEDTEESTHDGEELFFIVKGQATAIVDGKEFTVGEGETIHFPSSRPHKIVNRSDLELEMFMVVIPTIF